ncbi:MAG TPA: metalloprotease TldD [Aeromonadales bacterium]|nr:metalloprotease TldD [Aeromonadales bacterium]
MSLESFKLAEKHFLLNNQLNLTQAESVLNTAYCRGIDSADLYFQFSTHENWVLEDGIVKDGAFHQDQGAGIRSMVGEKTGFSYSEDLSLPALLNAAKAARQIIKQGQNGRIHLNSPNRNTPFYQPENPQNKITAEIIIALLSELDKTARAIDSRVKQVIASFSNSYQLMMILASDGTLASDARPLSRLSISIVVEENGRRERGNAGGGGRASPASLFLNQQNTASELALGYVKEAVRQASINLTAQPTPAGQMPVVLGSGWPGILLHEAIGHGLEGDFNRKGTSAFSKSMGDKVASPLCTIVDDATLFEKRGSLTVDDEGIPGQNTTLIENGRLVNYMMDKRNARLMGCKSTGNGRRESYAHLPLPRMTNTYMLPGDSHPDEIIASVEKGLYAPNFGGGQVDITSGKFVFSASEAYLIEKGKITCPVKGATLIGNGPEVLKEVSMVGNDLHIDPGVGICGKEGQSVPVGVGQPTLKIDTLLVGGTES